MKRLKKLLSIFLVLWVLMEIPQLGDGEHVLSNTDQPPIDIEIILDE